MPAKAAANHNAIMQIVRLSSARHVAPTPMHCALAVGNFDGLHPGHQAVITRARALATQEGMACAVLSFSPHPRRVFAPDCAPFLLQRPRQKAAELQALGVDMWYILRFDATTISLSAEAFMERVLAGMCNAKHVVTGDDFAFGHKRSGDARTLATRGEAHGFHAHAIAPISDGAVRYGSSAIREAVANGNIAAANQLLTRPYTVMGHVVHGDGRGEGIGFATANISHYPEQCMPAHGVYAVRLHAGGVCYEAVANCGTRPTFAGSGTRLEVHVLAGAPNLYGQLAQVELIAHIRSEQRFNTIDALKAQIAKDCEAARAIHAA